MIQGLPDPHPGFKSNSTLAGAADDGANRIEGKPSRLKKAYLLGPLLAGPRRDPEFSAPDFACAIDFGRARGPGCLLGKLLIEALRAQLVRDARRSILARKSVGARFRVALVGQEPASRQVFEQGFEVLLRTRVRPELPRQLGAAVLAPREKSQGPLAQRRPLFFHTSAVTGAHAPRAFNPNFSPVFASISSARVEVSCWESP